MECMHRRHAKSRRFHKREWLLIVLAAGIVAAAAVAMAHRTPPAKSSWVRVSGNALFGTGDFYMMKYLASCDEGGKPLEAPLEPTGGYDDLVASANSGSCIAVNGKSVVSVAGAPPLVDTSQGKAEFYCSSIGAHLMSNAEWQTAAWDIENVGSNWSGGEPGVGYIYSGHNDIAPRMALAASSSDADGYYGERNQGGSQRRTLALSDGEVVWDLAGNIWEWTSDDIEGKDAPRDAVPGPRWREFADITNWGAFAPQFIGPSDPLWNSSSGIGEIYSDGIPSNDTVYAFMRGGTMDYLGTAGIESLGLFNPPGNSFDAVGFRCARPA